MFTLATFSFRFVKNIEENMVAILWRKIGYFVLSKLVDSSLYFSLFSSLLPLLFPCLCGFQIIIVILSFVGEVEKKLRWINWLRFGAIRISWLVEKDIEPGKHRSDNPWSKFQQHVPQKHTSSDWFSKIFSFIHLSNLRLSLKMLTQGAWPVLGSFL